MVFGSVSWILKKSLPEPLDSSSKEEENKV